MATGIDMDLDDGVDYPDSDGRPIAETPIHRQNLTDLIRMLERHFDADPDAYASGGMLLYYRRGDRRAVVAPDVFLARGVDKHRFRRVYKTWVEGKTPDCVIELTSAATPEEDLLHKFELYRDELRIPEYFVFDPLEEYLAPSLQGFRLIDGDYVVISEVEGRLPSEVLGLHLERDGQRLRLVDPASGEYVLTDRESIEATEEVIRRVREAEEKIRRFREEARQAEEDIRRANEAFLTHREAVVRLQDDLRRSEATNKALRLELEELRRKLEGGGPPG